MKFINQHLRELRNPSSGLRNIIASQYTAAFLSFIAYRYDKNVQCGTISYNINEAVSAKNNVSK